MTMVNIMRRNYDPNKPGTAYTQLVQQRNKHKPNEKGRYPSSKINTIFGDYYYPSLWGYYNLLPVELRNHPFTMTILQGLEKYEYKVLQWES
jgi:hypothetical protein